MAANNLDEIVSLCKRRGFIFQNGELYGGLQGVYDYGPLGVEIKNNLKTAWWKSNVYERDDIVGLDTAILGHRLVFYYSGHEDTFADQLVDCHNCKHRWRLDHLVAGTCGHCGSKNLTEPRPFNTMFKTQLGPIEGNDAYAYLRPETAQGIFTNFKNVLDSSPRKLPFGIAQIGKAFRNEITPRNFIFRVREFEQMEIEFFVKPGDDEIWHQRWVAWRLAWWQQQGLSRDRLQLLPQAKADLAHYAKATVDILYQFPHGLEELEGISNRTDYDLGSHSRAQKDLNLQALVKHNTESTHRLAIFDLMGQSPIVPYVIEPSAGLDRGLLAVLTEAYHKETLENGSHRVVLKLKPHLAPIKVAVIPLARNQASLIEKAKQIQRQLQALDRGPIVLEDNGHIGKNYRRHDEIGTPVCITVDFATIGKSDDASHYDSVTVRQRDSMQQIRVPISQLEEYLNPIFRSASQTRD